MTRAKATTQTVRAGCYCRISSDPKDKREGVDRQRADTATLCEVKGWTIADVYIDNDRSASNGKARPEWERLLADIEAGKIDAVAAWDQDRVNRMMEDFVAYKKLFVEKGILLATSNNGDIDLSTPSGVLTATIKTAVSEHEVAMMRVRQLRAAQQRAQRGLPKWRRAFGYKPYTGTKEADTGVREIDPDVAKLVADAYRGLLAGRSITSIAKEWNAADRYGLTGKPWTPSTVSLFLRSPRNAGLRSHNDEIVLDADGKPVRGTWPPLVDENLWHATQAYLNAPDRRRPGPKSVSRHLLTGMLKCGKPECEGTLSGRWVMWPTGGQSGRPKAGQVKEPSGQVGHSITYGCKSCRGVAIRAEHVEPLVRAMVATRLAQPDAVDLIRSAQHDAEVAAKLRDDRVALVAKLDEIADMLADGELTREQAARATARTKDKLAALDSQDEDQDRKRILDGIPLGTPEVEAALAALTPDRFRAVLGSICEITVLPIGKGRRKGVEHRDRLRVDWLS